ncbi:hypothetical protein T06_9267 [Trichinella sp. T6]|nr:hypothetical protein T06_9267 [Trichinella sp. T6]
MVSVLASSSDSQDVAKSATASPATPGADARWRYACILTVLMAKKVEQVSPKHTIVNPLGLVPPEISTCVSVLFANLDLRIHLLNVRQQPYSLSGEQPPTGRSGWWVLLPAGPSRSSPVEFNKALSSCAFSPVDRVVWEIPGPYQWLILRCRFSPAVCNQDSLCHSPPGVA